ncbi:MAG: hypothetical protein WD696_21930 [Bryobacteraceae bacterium]
MRNRKDRERPEAEVVCHTHERTTTQAEGSLASTRAGRPGVRKKPLFTEKVNVF